MIIDIKDPIFDNRIIIFVGNEYWNLESFTSYLDEAFTFKTEELKNKLIKYAKKKVFPIKDEALCYQSKELCFIFMHNYTDDSVWHSTLSHEVLHATQFLMERIKTFLNNETKEIYAYYNQFLHKEILNQLWKPNKTENLEEQ